MAKRKQLPNILWNKLERGFGYLDRSMEYPIWSFLFGSLWLKGNMFETYIVEALKNDNQT